MNKIIDGKAFAESLRARIAKQIADLRVIQGFVPGLAVVLVGENPASQVYVRNKAKQTVEKDCKKFNVNVAVEATVNVEATDVK